MNVLAQLRRRFAAALTDMGESSAELVEMVRPSQDAKFGDYQANFAMPLARRLGRPPREVASDVAARLTVDDLCDAPEIAGPGFINLRLSDAALAAILQRTFESPRLDVARAERPRTFVVDYSAPNVAKPMHVGHIRSTVIGDALVRTLSFLGHRAIGDNHIGDWGTQFGMILYGYKRLRDTAAYEANPVAELSRLYRLVNTLVEYEESQKTVPDLTARIAAQQAERERHKHTGQADKKQAKEDRRLERELAELRAELNEIRAKQAAVERDAVVSRLAREHPEIGAAVLAETARLHAGDAENLALWRQFLPACLADIQQIYDRLGVRFDHTLGESFYQPRLAAVVDDLRRKGIARESEGAVCIFFADGDPPMVIQKRDGAYLYATTDLATIQYRMETWRPDAMLYVVDHRQNLHFEQLFAAARRWGCRDVELVHVSFGTVLGDDGRPFKTRSGDTVGLSSLLDEAVRRALAVVSAGDDAELDGRRRSHERRRQIAETVGIAALKYADLSQNRTSDYVFSYDKMLAMNGNTATYMQYAYARVRSIFAKGGVDAAALHNAAAPFCLTTPAERALGLELVRFEEALEACVTDYRPNTLTNYLFELANRYSTFFEQCPVLKAESEPLRQSRLMLCDLTARTLKQGLELLGIAVVEQM